MEKYIGTSFEHSVCSATNVAASVCWAVNKIRSLAYEMSELVEDVDNLKAASEIMKKIDNFATLAECGLQSVITTTDGLHNLCEPKIA